MLNLMSRNSIVLKEIMPNNEIKIKINDAKQIWFSKMKHSAGKAITTYTHILLLIDFHRFKASER